jgi:hypothetical protein
MPRQLQNDQAIRDLAGNDDARTMPKDFEPEEHVVLLNEHDAD